MAKKNDNSNDLSARLAALDEEFGITPTPQEEPEPPKKVETPKKKAEKKSKKEPIENNGISHSFETEESPAVSPPVKKKKEKKSLFGFGKKRKDAQKETDLAMEQIAEEFDVPKELVYSGPNKKRTFGRKAKDASEENQIPKPVPLPIPEFEDPINHEEENFEQIEENIHYEDIPEEKIDVEVQSAPEENEFEEEETIVSSSIKQDEDDILPPYLSEEDEDLIRPQDLDEEIESQPINENIDSPETPEVEDANKNDFLSKLKSKKKKNQEKTVANTNKKKSPLLNIFLIALIAIIGLILAITLISKLFGGNDNSEISISSSEFETAEQISVQKAKELIEETNSVDEIVGFEEGEEIKFEGGEGFASDNKTSNNQTGLVSFREEEVVVNSNGLVPYSNARFGASFEHPPEWTELTGFTAKETAKNVSNVVMVGYPAESDTIENVRISMEGTPVSISSKEYFSKTEGLMGQTFNKFSLIKKGETTANGGEAPYRIYQWIPTSEEEEHTYEKYKTKIKQYQVYLAGKEKVYVVTFTAEASVFDKNFEKYNKVLSTLSLQR